MRELPPLPPAFTRMRTVIGVGTLLWLAAAAVVAGRRDLAALLTTCLVGAGLGGVGWAIFAWQRAAARRGSRTAQRRPRALIVPQRADSFFHWSHDSVQSQMSPSRAASWTGVPVTSTGSP